MHEDPEFRWLERGAGEPVVLLHGLMGQMHHWDVVLDAVGDGYRLIAPTLPVLHPARGAGRELARWARGPAVGAGVRPACVGAGAHRIVRPLRTVPNKLGPAS